MTRWHRHESYPFPWPATCLHCDLVTEDPDGFFYPPDVEVDRFSECFGSPSGMHELDWTVMTCRSCKRRVESGERGLRLVAR